MAIREGRRITLRDVAQAAGVSLKTASNVINGTGRMSEQTRAKVQAVVDGLGYQVNVAARNLNRRRTGVITLAVPTLVPPYLAQLANDVIDAARGRGYSVYVTTYDERDGQGLRGLLDGFNSTVSDGMVLSLGEAVRFGPQELRVDYPLVCVGARDTGDVADHVTTDDVAAGATAAGYLFDHGSRRLAVVGARDDYGDGFARLATAVDGNAQLRLRGIVEEAAARGLPLDPRFVGNTGDDWTIGSGYRTMRRLIDGGADLDGVVALNDQLAIGAISALTAAGLEIPGQVQVIGFDDIEEAAYLPRPLTTMASCLGWIAPTAVGRLVERIEGSVHAPELIETRSHVVARATTRE